MISPLKFISFYLILSSFLWAQAGKRQVAITSFKNQSEDREKYEFLKDQIPSLIEARLKRENKIQIQTRRNLKSVFDEVKLVQAGFLEKTKKIEIQNLIQSDYLIVGNYQASQDEVRVNYQLIKVSSGEIRFVSNLRSDDYGQLLWDIERTAGMATAEILDQRVSFLSVNSTPRGAGVYLNGNFIGKSPVIQYPLSAGKHEMILSMENHIEQKKELNIQRSQKHTEDIKLYFKGHELYKNQILFSIPIGLPTLGSGLSLKDGLNGFRISLGYQKYFHGFLLGVNWSLFQNRHVNKIRVFGEETEELRRFLNNYLSVHVKYHYLLAPSWIGIFGGVSLGWRHILNDDLTSDRTDFPYRQSHQLFQLGAHAGFNLFPVSELGLIFELSYLPTPKLDSFVGSFNPLGEKSFSTIPVATQQFIFSFGFRSSLRGALSTGIYSQ